MSGNIYFHPEYARTVCVDIRFVLWIIDRYAGASGLIESSEESHLHLAMKQDSQWIDPMSRIVTG